jgi:hypothetical protein
VFHKAKEIEGGTTIEDSADMFINIISGKGTEAQCSLCQRWNGHCNRNKMYSFRRFPRTWKDLSLNKDLKKK